MECQIYGDHETQVSEGGEADLHKHFSSCKKNQGHTNFIPVDSFTLNHLPESHRDNDLYEMIKAAAGLTVRVAANKISEYRPEFWPNTTNSYPFYDIRDKTDLRTGSGFVSKVSRFTDTANHVWWEFKVVTATHVVFDNYEASHTSVRFFYDKEESPLVSIDHVSVDGVNIEKVV